MRLEIRDLRLVAAIDEHGTLTRAGQFLHLTQSALSHQLKDLEAQIGVQLCQRLGKRMIPTRVGAQIAARGRELLRELKTLEEEVLSQTSSRDAILRIATECYTCYHWLPTIFQAFAEKYPRVEIQVVSGATSRPVHALLAGKIDLCLITHPPRDRRVNTVPLFEDEMVAIVPPTHPFAEREYVEPQDFANEHLFIYNSLDDNYTFEHVLAPAGVKPKQVSTIQLTEATFELVKAGHGISVVARWTVEPHVRSGALVAVPVTKEGVRRVWYAATRAYRNPPAYLDEFAQFLRQTIRSTKPGVRPPALAGIKTRRIA
jgi:LysR family transcriptional regulator for metE and metH